MIDARRRAYLDAMGIDLWLPRGRPPPAVSGGAPRITVGAGAGDILCIARTAAEAGTKLAADIARAMRSAPVWAWPAPDGEGDSIGFEDAVRERMMTRVLVFGEELAASLFGPAPPETVAAARVHLVPGLERLAAEREAKRILWMIMCEQGIAARQGSGKMSS